MVATILPLPPAYHPEESPDLPQAPRRLLPGQLADEQLRRAFKFLRIDYMATIAGTAGLPNDERFELVRQRLADYSNALAEALGDAADDAAILVRGLARQRGEVR